VNHLPVSILYSLTTLWFKSTKQIVCGFCRAATRVGACFQSLQADGAGIESRLRSGTTQSPASLHAGANPLQLFWPSVRQMLSAYLHRAAELLSVHPAGVKAESEPGMASSPQLPYEPQGAQAFGTRCGSRYPRSCGGASRARADRAQRF
jgi:hypothetical protein